MRSDHGRTRLRRLCAAEPPSARECAHRTRGCGRNSRRPGSAYVVHHRSRGLSPPQRHHRRGSSRGAGRACACYVCGGSVGIARVSRQSADRGYCACKTKSEHEGHEGHKGSDKKEKEIISITGTLRIASPQRFHSSIATSSFVLFVTFMFALALARLAHERGLGLP